MSADDDAVARLLAEREAAGYPRHVTDPGALAQLAALLDGAREAEAAVEAVAS